MKQPPAFAVNITRGDSHRTVAWTADGTGFGMTVRVGHTPRWERLEFYDLDAAPVAGAGNIIWLADGDTRVVTLRGLDAVPDAIFDPEQILADVEAARLARIEAARQQELARIEEIEQRKRDAAAEAKQLEREAKRRREALEESPVMG